MHRLPCLPAGNLLTSCERHRESVIKISLYPPGVFFCGGAQLSWGFLALGSVLSVALLGGWSLFGTFAGLLGFWAFSPWENSSFGLVGLLVTLRIWGFSFGQYGTLGVPSLSFGDGSGPESLPCSVGRLRSLPLTYEKENNVFCICFFEGFVSYPGYLPLNILL